MNSWLHGRYMVSAVRKYAIVRGFISSG